MNLFYSLTQPGFHSAPTSTNQIQMVVWPVINILLCLGIFVLLLSPSHSGANDDGSNHQHQHQHQHHHSHFAPHGYISNATLSGSDEGCKFYTKYETTNIVSFQMCVGQNPQDLKNGMSIINLIQSRGYLPTCRVLHLMLWMQSEVTIGGNSKLGNRRDTFVDIGANIGSCSNHIASLGYPVISAEPVREHVNTIKGTMESNPSFHIELNHVGISSEVKTMNVSFGHGARNWGASIFEEDNTPNAQATLDLKTVDQLVGPRRVSLMKIDCEGCEWSAIMGAKRTLRKTPMLKIELVQPKYTDGNTTATPEEVVKFLYEHGFELFKDHWLENYLY